MRSGHGIHFQMSERQRDRLARAYELIQHNTPHSSSLVSVGDTIPVLDSESSVLRGHGTQQLDGQLMSTLCGIVERVDKLVSVRPLRSRYNAETGDVVIGRITDLGPKRWKVDINSKHDVQLMLSAVNLPGGIQRRRTAVDELNMRSLFEENDLISSEVQSVNQDGSVHLHTRSLKYGKLEKGQLVIVAPYLVKRMKQHFHQLSHGIDIILGCNGYIWLSGSPLQEKADGEDAYYIPLEVREKVCRFANAIRVLNTLGFLIHPEPIVDTYEASCEWKTEIKDMLGAEFSVMVAEREANRRSNRKGYQ